jgi:hypothetical protein
MFDSIIFIAAACQELISRHFYESQKFKKKMGSYDP